MTSKKIYLVADERSSNARCTITCAEPCCTNQIRYNKYDYDVPLYCEKHRTLNGRHSAVRKLKKPVGGYK